MSNDIERIEKVVYDCVSSGRCAKVVASESMKEYLDCLIERAEKEAKEISLYSREYLCDWLKQQKEELSR